MGHGANSVTDTAYNVFFLLHKLSDIIFLYLDIFMYINLHFCIWEVITVSRHNNQQCTAVKTSETSSHVVHS